METFDTENAGVVGMFFPQKSYSSTTPNCVTMGSGHLVTVTMCPLYVAKIKMI
jgi:hypothetical protein